MNLILFNDTGTAGSLYWSQSQRAPSPPTTSTPTPMGAHDGKERLQHTARLPSPSQLCVPVNWTHLVRELLRQQPSFHSRECTLELSLRQHWPYTKVALYKPLLELPWTPLSWARKALQACFSTTQMLSSAITFSPQLDKLYVWAVTFPLCKYSRGIIQQIALGYK